MAFVNFRNSVAGAALIAVMALPVTGFAQTATPEAPAATPEAPAAQSAPVALPPALANLGLTDVTQKDARRGKLIDAKLNGTDFRAFTDAAGTLRAVMMKDAALPQPVLDALLPQPVRGAQIAGQFAEIHGLRLGEGDFGIMGKDSAGERMHAVFAEDGTLKRFGRGDGPRMGDKGGFDKGKKGFGKDHKGGKKGDRRDGRTGDRAGPMGTPLDDAALREAATAAGYTNLGEIAAAGPRRMINATNPQGEAVTVEIAPNGKVLRETAR